MWRPGAFTFFHTLQAGQYIHTTSTPAPSQVSLHALPAATVDLTGLLDDL